MKIAVIAPPRFAIREPFAGGLEAQVWHTCAALQSLGVEVELYGAVGSHFAAPGLQFPLPDWSASGLPASDTTLPPATAREHARLMHVLLDRLASDVDGYDLVHNQCLYPEPLDRAGELPMPMLTTLHTPPFWELTDVLHPAAGAFVAVSAHIRDAWAMLDRSVPVIPNGIDISRWPVGPGGPDLAWFGRLVPEKAPHLAIDAARLAGRSIVLAGRIGDRRYFDDEVRPRLGPGARHLGALHQRQIASLVGSSRAVLVTPMWPEPFGLVAAEAAACGTPVAAFAAGGLPEVVIDGVTGRCVPQGSVDALAAAVDEVGQLDRRQVRAAALARFDVRVMAERYLALYRELVASVAREIA